MAIQVVAAVVMVVLGSVRAWPISTTDTNQIKNPNNILVGCGESLERGVGPYESLQVFLNGTDLLTERCDINLRLFVLDNGLAKYGLRVEGNLQASSQDDCSSSLLIHDNDDDTDQNAISETFCRSGHVSYRTMEDVILFRFQQGGGGGEGGAAGVWGGAALTVTPELVCGGTVMQDAILAVHHYNFKQQYVCNWRLVPGEGQVVRVTFDHFKMTPPKGNRCKSEGVIFIPSDLTHYCGDHLLHQTKEFFEDELMSLRVTRASTLFTARVEYVEDKRKVQ